MILPSARMPAVFLGHGNPMNALVRNRWTEAWRALGASLRPRAILAISAHWFIGGPAVTVSARPRTIHDFRGFPRALFDLRYDAPGDPALAREVASALAPEPVAFDETWGLDHGTWSLLVHLYPGADVPVVQLAIDATRQPAWHWDLASRLAPLRDSGVLILASGNVVHNLSRLDFGAAAPQDWAVRFDAHVQAALDAGDRSALLGYEAHPEGLAAVPTPDHYLPLLYAAALRSSADALTTVTDGFDAGSISMRGFRIG